MIFCQLKDENTIAQEKTEEPRQETLDIVNEPKKQVEKSFLNAPSWSEELCEHIQKANHWTSIAEKLSFSEAEISTWNDHTNPTECMLKEWFLTKKKLEATTGLLEVFKELNMQVYVDLIENYSKKIEKISRYNSYDEESDFPQVFISFEHSAAEQARLLKQDLEKFNFIVWLDDSKLENSRSSSSKSNR